MKTGIAYSERYLEHELGPRHPEKPERLRSIMEALMGNDLLSDGVDMIEPEPASVEDIELAHEPSYVEEIRRLSEEGGRVDLDTPINKDTYELALLAAGGTVDLAERVLEGEVRNGFALVRPPGHHATRSKGGGFCYFNNIAIATRKALLRDGIDRVLIFDFDSHHGNGTQDIFYSDDKVLYMSFHQDGKTLYPGTGFPEEVGEGDGEGFTVNVPFPPGSTNRNYVAALREFLVPISEQFDPDLIMSSAGFDPHVKDPLTQLEVSTMGFEWLGRSAIKQANDLCDGRIGFVLEGGYAIEASTDSALRIIKSLIDLEPPELPEGREVSSFQEVREALGPYWDI